MVAARAFPFRGGIETHIYEVSKRLAAEGQRVTVLSSDPGNTLPTDETTQGVRNLRVRAWPRNKDYYFAPSIYRVIRAGGWDIVHVQGYHTFVPPLAMLAATQSHIPFIVTFHSGGHSNAARHAIRGLQQRSLRPLLSRAERLVGVSEFEAELFRRHSGLPPERFVVIPNGVDLPVASRAQTKRGSEVLVLSVGRLERYKGHHRLIAAMPKILARRPETSVMIVGSGPYEQALRAQANDLGVKDHIEFRVIHAADRAGMANLYAEASLTVLLSDYEAHPVSVMEALGLGCPVLVTYSSGLAELTDKGLTQSVPIDATPDAVAQAIIESLDHPLIRAARRVGTDFGD